MQADINIDCERCRKIKTLSVTFLLIYVNPEPGVIGIAHNAKSFDGQFTLQRAILLKWRTELNLSGLKIICMRMEHLLFIDSISYLPMPLHKLPEAFGLSVRISWYPHYFNTKTNLNYVGPMPDVSQYGVDEMSMSE